MIPHHVVTGPEDAPALVLSNSLGTTLRDVGPAGRRARRALPAVRYDTRGHGELATTPPGPYTIDDVGRDVLDLLDHLGIERAHFAGLSLGGMTGMWLGDHTRPSGSTGSSCSAPRRRWARREMWADRAKPCASRAPQAIVDGTLERWLTEGYRAEHPTSTRLREMFVGIDDEGYASCCAIIEHMDLTRRPAADHRADAGHRRRAGPGDAARRARRGDRRRDPRRAARGPRPRRAPGQRRARRTPSRSLILEHLEA